MQNRVLESLSQTPGAEPQGGDERYVLRMRRDIMPVFVALAKWPVQIKVLVQQLGVSIETRLIALHPEFEELVFDASALPGAERLDGSAGLSAETQMDAVWFRFDAGHVGVVHGYPVPAFRARIPDTIARVQRRDSIRYPVPGINPPVCELPGEDPGENAQRLRAIDISNSGIALRLDDSRVNIKAGSTLEGCLLHLPDIGAIATDLRVMYLAPLGQGDQRRIGCRFTNMRATSLDHLRRYVGRLERERLAARGEA